MASSVISLGIGSPASIEYFITLGLEPAPTIASPYQIISQGIGSPASIPYFLLLGLSGEGSAPPTSYTGIRSLTLDGREISVTLLFRDWTGTMQIRDITGTLRSRESTLTGEQRETTLTLKKYTDD